MSLYKCVIIDDEPLICKLIQKLGAWNDMNIEVVATCYDGESAINAIQEYKPDIVLSDIQVPIYNGLQIIEKVQSLNLHPFFVIISGYSQFEYAQRAIQLMAVDYLVKPIKKDKLNMALQKCCDLLSIESSHEATSAALADAHRDLFWNDIYNKRYSCTTAASFSDTYGRAWNEGPHYSAIITISRPELFEHEALFYDQVSSIVSANLKELTYSCDFSNGCIYLVFSFNSEIHKNIELFFQKLFMDIKHLETTISSFFLCIGYSKAFLSPSEMLNAFKEAEEAVLSRFEFGSDDIYSYTALPDNIYTYKNFLTENFVNNLLFYSKRLDELSLQQQLQTLSKNFIESSGHDFAKLTDLCCFILNYVLNTLHTSEPEIIQEKFLFDFQFCSSYEEVFNQLYQTIADTIKKKKEASFVELSSSIKIAKEYINKHYTEKIYLDDIAKAVFLSPTYLSAIFKKELGMNITDYIHIYRCTKAKEMLKETNTSLATIAEAVGYSDEKYFQNQFKKFVGITPAQFRRVYS